MTCAVCGSASISTHAHHVVPQASGGARGPTVDLCGDCHTAIHAAAGSAAKNRPFDDRLAHLTESARARALDLVRLIVAATRVAAPNPNPVLTVTLSPETMRALDMFKADRGFTSREQAVRAVMHELALHYGTLSVAEPRPPGTSKTTSLARFRGGGER